VVLVCHKVILWNNEDGVRKAILSPIKHACICNPNERHCRTGGILKLKHYDYS